MSVGQLVGLHNRLVHQGCKTLYSSKYSLTLGVLTVSVLVFESCRNQDKAPEYLQILCVVKG